VRQLRRNWVNQWLAADRFWKLEGRSPRVNLVESLLRERLERLGGVL
jgi:hypothetical protein